MASGDSEKMKKKKDEKKKPEKREKKGKSTCGEDRLVIKEVFALLPGELRWSGHRKF